jgi:hypothetical protein
MHGGVAVSLQVFNRFLSRFSASISWRSVAMSLICDFQRAISASESRCAPAAGRSSAGHRVPDRQRQRPPAQSTQPGKTREERLLALSALRLAVRQQVDQDH